MKKILTILLSLGAVLGVGGYFLVKEAYAATPADSLFAVQEIADDIQRTFTFDDVAKTELEQEILVRRQEQVERMTERDDITEDQLEEGLQLMAQQRTRVQERLQTVEQNQTNEKATKAIENVQQQYDENLDKQLETIGKAQEKGEGIGKSVEEETVEEAIQRGRNVPWDIEDQGEEEKGNTPSNSEERGR